MKVSSSLLSFLLLCVVFVEQAHSESCFDIWESMPNNNMGTCCWYADDTCCTYGSGFAPSLTNVSNYLYDQITDNGTYATFDLNQCYTYYDNFICSVCAPDASGYVRTAPAPMAITVCQSFCDDWYSACANIPEVGARFAQFNISTGSELCYHIPVAAERYETEVLNITDPTAPFIVVIDQETENCFSGVSSQTIGESTCTPWNGDYVNPDSSESSENKVSESEISSGEDGEGDGDDESGFYWIFIVIAIGVVLLIVVAVVVVAFFLWKRKQAASVTEAAANYPDLDELDDYD